ncbi:MAG: HIT family protein [Pseudomonadota bacterium]|nr:HIT family protein [Pseudomonadota bacterium]
MAEMNSPDKQPDCIFCQPEILVIRQRSARFYVIEDLNPVTAGHLLIIPYQHIINPLDLAADEMTEAWQLIQQLTTELRQQDATITGFNIGMNCGYDAGQSIFHSHIHLIPRRQGDMENPRGGVRGVIPAKQHY